MAQAPALPGGFELPLEPRLPRVGAVDAVAARGARGDAREALDQARVEAAGARSRHPRDDLTTLEGADTPGKVSALARRRCVPTRPTRRSRRSRRCASTRTSCRPPSSACAAPREGRLRRHRVPVRPVAARREARRHARCGRGGRRRDRHGHRPRRFLSGRYAKVYDEIVRMKEACGDAHLKVILETGELGTYDNVRRAALLAIAAGADFVKTSTGKISPAPPRCRSRSACSRRPRRLRRDRPRASA